MLERDLLATVTTTLHCNGSLAMVTARNLKMVDPAVELVSLIFCQPPEELFNSLMARYRIFYFVFVIDNLERDNDIRRYEESYFLY